MEMSEILAGEFHLKEEHVRNVIQLIDDGNTIPFIARYRKEMTGSLDDQVLRELCDRLDYLRRMEEQREKVRASIDEQGQLTGELAAALAAAVTLTEIEDIYRPYRPKRRTRASAAKEKGLQPLADALYAQPKAGPPAEELAAPYVDGEKGVESAADALAGAADILAELAADDPNGRKRLRVVCLAGGELTAKAVDDDPGVYAPYADYREPLRKLPGHRILAVNRGEAEKKLKVAVEFDRAKALSILRSIHVKDGSVYADIVGEAVADAWDRLLFPSLERELRGELTDRASEDAIRVFSLNLRQLLMQPPVKGKVALGLDPGYRNGCKAAVVDPTGRVLDTGVIYPVPPFNRVEQAKKTVTGWILRHGVQVVAIGNGTASRETEIFAAGVIKELAASSPAAAVSYMVVSEAGASVYSASKLGAEEFPDFDVSLRSAVSIARRLQDPLAELVKIDPKAIGVGQYQHDMPQARLSETLDGVVEDCVNAVGVDLNTASPSLLRRVAGITPTVAKNVTVYREENGSFKTRRELLKVPKLGPKAFEQCAGFLRVPESRQVLDRTAVHPESYKAAEKLLEICGYTLKDVGSLFELDKRLKELGTDKAAEACGVGVPTLRDIAAELQKPGRDPRDQLPPPILRTDVMDIADLKPGMKLTGTVRNVVDFGAFVDIGVHQDGLVHISQLSDRFVRDPSLVVKVGDIVEVTVLEVDERKKRISLSMKKQAQ